MSIENIITKKIKNSKGFIGFDEFMDIALYDKKFGYYRRKEIIFAENGDFITSPEVSDLFGYCLARQVSVFTKNNFDVLEFGAGSGKLAKQILLELSRLNSLPENYYIIELSALRKKQQKDLISTLPKEISSRVKWLNSLPDNYIGVMIANEVLDAMPVKRILYNNNNFFELGVGEKSGNFYWKLSENVFDKHIDFLPNNVENNFITEINLNAISWINAIYDSIEKGVVFLIDYGMNRKEYHHIDRFKGTLRCYSKNKISDNPFDNIGKQDITASVNFSDISQTAKNIGFNLDGYCNQAMFLISMGISDYLLQEKDTLRYIKLTEQIKKLIMPGAMGDVFKVLALSKNQSLELQCFTEQNLLNAL